MLIIRNLAFNPGHISTISPSPVPIGDTLYHESSQYKKYHVLEEPARVRDAYLK